MTQTEINLEITADILESVPGAQVSVHNTMQETLEFLDLKEEELPF